MIGRLIAGAATLVAVGMVVGLGAPDELARAAEDATPVPAASTPTGGAGTSTWFCAAGAPEGGSHTVSIANPSAREGIAQVTSRAPGDLPAVVAQVPLPASTVTVVDESTFAGAQPGSVLVEGPAGIAVSHRMVIDGSSDDAVCVTRASATWFFPANDSQRGGTAKVSLFNPLLTDASLDITVATDSSVRVPGALSGLVVPAGSTRVVELGEEAQRRDQFSASIVARSGRVVAELVQLSDGTSSPQGLRIQPGIDTTSSRVLFPDSEGVDGVNDRFVLLNPSRDPLEVDVAVRPDAGDPPTYPEPLHLTVPARRYLVVDLGAESRIPPTGARSVTVETDDPDGVVVVRLVSVNASNGWGLQRGLGNSTGSVASSTRWIVPRVDAAEPGRSILRLSNTSSDSISVVTIRPVAPGVDASAASEVEVPPGRTVTADVGALAQPDVPTALLITSTGPVTVDRRAFSSTLADFWIGPAVPTRDRLDPLGSLPDATLGG